MDFIDLKAQYSHIQHTVRQRINAVLEHGQYIMGPEIGELEGALAHMAGTKHCLSCASGTDALLMTLMAWNIGPGDAVFVPSFTFFATAEVVSLLGATPVFVDVDPLTFLMQPTALEKAIKGILNQDATHYPLPAQALVNKLTPKAIIPVDLFGIVANYQELLPIARTYSLQVLEDAAQAFGACRQGRAACGHGCDAAVTSFFPAKPLGCYGDGGAIFTDDYVLAERLRSIRVHGKGADKYENIRIGLNGRMDTLQAAIILAKLPYFTQEIDARQKVARHYTTRLAHIKGIILPTIPDDCQSVFAQYSIVVEAGRRDSLHTHLQQKGIPTNIYYPKPLHVQMAFAHLQYQAEDMPISTTLSRNILSLPFHPYMTVEDIDTVCTAIQEKFQ